MPRCATHYHRRHDELAPWPPLPEGLLEAVTARLKAVRHGLPAEAEASRRLWGVIAKRCAA